MYDPKRKEALRRDADIPHAAVPSGPFPGWVRGRSERFADPNVLTRRTIQRETLSIRRDILPGWIFPYEGLYALATFSYLSALKKKV